MTMQTGQSRQEDEDRTINTGQSRQDNSDRTTNTTIFQLYCDGSFYWWSKPGESLEHMVVERRDHILLYENIPINMSTYDNLFKYEYICNVLFVLPHNTLCPLHLYYT
jgi:hypothetical protein